MGVQKNKNGEKLNVCVEVKGNGKDGNFGDRLFITSSTTRKDMLSTYQMSGDRQHVKNKRTDLLDDINYWKPNLYSSPIKGTAATSKKRPGSADPRFRIITSTPSSPRTKDVGVVTDSSGEITSKDQLYVCEDCKELRNCTLQENKLLVTPKKSFNKEVQTESNYHLHSLDTPLKNELQRCCRSASEGCLDDAQFTSSNTTTSSKFREKSKKSRRRTVNTNKLSTKRKSKHHGSSRLPKENLPQHEAVNEFQRGDYIEERKSNDSMRFASLPDTNQNQSRFVVLLWCSFTTFMFVYLIYLMYTEFPKFYKYLFFEEEENWMYTVFTSILPHMWPRYINSIIDYIITLFIYIPE